MACSHSFLYRLLLNVRALTTCIQTPSDFLTVIVIEHNHKSTATSPLTFIAAVYNHSISTFASLALVPSPPLSEKQWDHYLSFLEYRVLYSYWEHDANSYIDLLLVLGWHVIRTGAHTDEWGWRRRILGYRMAGAFFNCSKVFQRIKRGMGKRSMKRKRRANMMASMLLQEW